MSCACSNVPRSKIRPDAWRECPLPIDPVAAHGANDVRTVFWRTTALGVSRVCSDVPRSQSDPVRIENALCRSIRVSADGR